MLRAPSYLGAHVHVEPMLTRSSCSLGAHVHLEPMRTRSPWSLGAPCWRASRAPIGTQGHPLAYRGTRWHAGAPIGTRQG
eukprot:6652544-Pyramimonas_sp.AAC.3